LKFKKLYIYGDSFVHGDKISQNLTWANLLGKDLNLKVFNKGVAGCSNRLSTINLLDDMNNLKKYDDIIVIFGWTSIHRSCVYINDTKEWYNLSVHYKNKNEFLHQVETNYYKYFHSTYDALYNFYSQKIFVQSFLSVLKIKYFFINSFIDPKYGEEKIYKELNRHEKLIEKNQYLLGYTNSIRDEVCLKRKLIGEDGFHPSIQGHKIAADLILKEMEILL
jgi:hypothetical protein